MRGKINLKMGRMPFKVLSLTIPIHIWDLNVWRGIEGRLRHRGLMGSDDKVLAFATTDRLGIASIAFSEQVWRKSNPKTRGWIMTHELLHLLRNTGKLRKKAERREEAAVERFQPRNSLVARVLSDGCVLLVKRKR